MSDWIEGADDWLEGAAAWIAGAVEAAVEYVRGGLPVRRKPPQSHAPHIQTDREFTGKLVAEIRAKEDDEEAKRRETERLNAEFEHKEKYRKMAEKSVEKRRLERLAEERKRLERDTNLALGREVRKQNIQKRTSTPQKSETAAFTEKKRADREKMARLRQIRKRKK